MTKYDQNYTSKYISLTHSKSEVQLFLYFKPIVISAHPLFEFLFRLLLLHMVLFTGIGTGPADLAAAGPII